MKRRLWCCGILCWALSVQAQTPFRSITVLDKRPDTATIYTKMRREFPPEHYVYPVGALFKGSMGGQAFLLVRLFAFGVPNGSARHKHLSFSADAYVQTGADAYTFLLTYQKTYPFGDLSHLPALLRKAVGDFLGAAERAYARRGAPGARLATAAAGLTLAQVADLSPFAILDTDTLVSGTYATFADFRDNRVHPCPVVLTCQDSAPSCRLDSPRSILPWALSDGANLYIHWQGVYYTRLDKLPSGFSFRVPLSRGQLRLLNTTAMPLAAGGVCSAPLDLSGLGGGNGKGSAVSALVVVGIVVGTLVVIGVTAAIIRQHNKLKLQMLTDGYRMGYLDLDREEVFYDWQPYASR